MHKDTTRRSGEISLLASTAILLTALAMGCAMEDPISDSEPEIEASEATILAEIITGDGVEYTFLEIDAEDLGVTVMVPGPMAEPLPDLGSDMSLVELYQTVSGRPAPEALVTAEKRVADNRRSNDSAIADEDQPPRFSPGDATEDDTTDDKQTEGIQALTAAQFEAQYCPSGWDFKYCWPNTGGNPYVQRRAHYLKGVVHATNCYTRVRYRYRKALRWVTFVDKTVAPGHTYWAWKETAIKRRKRWEVLDNQGCGVRYSAFGND